MQGKQATCNPRNFEIPALWFPRKSPAKPCKHLQCGTYCETSECTKHPNYGAIMFIPIIMANLFTIPHWFKRENTWKKRLCTLPLFLGQFWPQYQALKVFWLIKNKDLRWRKKKEQLDREIGSIEPFLESLPQVNIIFFITF